MAWKAFFHELVQGSSKAHVDATGSLTADILGGFTDKMSWMDSLPTDAMWITVALMGLVLMAALAVWKSESGTSSTSYDKVGGKATQSIRQPLSLPGQVDADESTDDESLDSSAKDPPALILTATPTLKEFSSQRIVI